jgi:ABC-type lipoprotein release transport system permease subunit
MTLIVSGIFKTPDPQVNSGMAFIPLDILQDEMGMMLNGKVTDLSIRKKGFHESDRLTGSEQPEVIRKIAAPFLQKNLIVSAPVDTIKEAMSLAETNAVFYNLLILFIVVLAVIGLTNTIYIALLQRKTEMGMMRAIGMNDRDIVILYCLEAGLIGLFGALIGLAGGAFFTYLMVNYGIDMSAMMDASSVGSFRIYAFKSVWKPESFVIAFFASFLLSAMIALFPAGKSLKIPAVEALNRE